MSSSRVLDKIKRQNHFKKGHSFVTRPGAALGIDPVNDQPTAGPLCTSPGDCVFQIEVGCGDGSLVDVEISNFVTRSPSCAFRATTFRWAPRSAPPATA